jgi:phosphatidylinositol kinase/protein kinase (PI-3  family)
MIAHLYESEHHLCLTKIIKEILIYVGQTHPESILYSLIFAARSKIPERIRPAEETIEKIRLKFPALTEEIWTISKELSKAAIKLKEFWYDGIESAWSIYNQSKSTSEVLAMLKDLKEEVMSRKRTNSEIAFHH